MTQEQRSDFMNNVRWVTAGVFFFSAVSLIITIVLIYAALRDDITNTNTHIDKVGTDAKIQLTAVAVAINRRIDSNEFNHRVELQAIWTVINSKYSKDGQSNLKLYTEKKTFDGNGKPVIRFIPVN